MDHLVIMEIQDDNEQNVLNSLTNDKFLDWFKLKAFADDKIDVT